MLEEDVACCGDLTAVAGGVGDTEFHVVVIEVAFGVRIFQPLAWSRWKTEAEAEDERFGSTNGKSALFNVVGKVVWGQVNEWDCCCRSWCCFPWINDRLPC